MGILRRDAILFVGIELGVTLLDTDKGSRLLHWQRSRGART
jgi:hypothetical protein